jgi:hypothetical protein
MLLSAYGGNLLALCVVDVDQAIPLNAHGAACEAHHVVDVDRISTGDYCSDFFVQGYLGLGVDGFAVLRLESLGIRNLRSYSFSFQFPAVNLPEKLRPVFSLAAVLVRSLKDSPPADLFLSQCCCSTAKTALEPVMIELMT